MPMIAFQLSENRLLLETRNPLRKQAGLSIQVTAGSSLRRR
jgi:hypothetical protein